MLRFVKNIKIQGKGENMEDKTGYCERLIKDAAKAINNLKECRADGKIDEDFYLKEMKRLETIKKDVEKYLEAYNKAFKYKIGDKVHLNRAIKATGEIIGRWQPSDKSIIWYKVKILDGEHKDKKSYFTEEELQKGER